ncbi:HK97 gp10 family phage protein [Eubacterium aggregans]|uniref:HK97 gp10 family phage protein n=1 Tax=Eubacterium aggregans TaxID=81409 RepID=UPI003F324056
MPDNSDFMASLEQATLKIVQQTAANMKTACTLVEWDAKHNCPVDQGQLRADIHSVVHFDDKKIVGTIGNSVKYAEAVHNGSDIYAKDGNGRKDHWIYKAEGGKHAGWHTTRGKKPQPYLEDAKMSNLSKIPGILAGD